MKKILFIVFFIPFLGKTQCTNWIHKRVDKDSIQSLIILLNSYLHCSLVKTVSDENSNNDEYINIEYNDKKETCGLNFSYGKETKIVNMISFHCPVKKRIDSIWNNYLIPMAKQDSTFGRVNAYSAYFTRTLMIAKTDLISDRIAYFIFIMSYGSIRSDGK